MDFQLYFNGRHAPPSCRDLISYCPKWLPTPELGGPALAAHRLIAAGKLDGFPLCYIIWSLALLTVILGFGDTNLLILLLVIFVRAQLSEDPMT